MIKRNLRTVSILLIGMLLAGTVLSGCRIFRGDPRKNCNHPQHGKYMQEQRMKKQGF